MPDPVASLPPPPVPAQQSVIVQPAPAPAPMTVNVAVIGEWAGAIAAIAVVIALLAKLVTRDLARDVAGLTAKSAETTAAIGQLQQHRTADLERLVKLEVAFAEFPRHIERVEKQITTEFGQLAASIRELRSVAPRP